MKVEFNNLDLDNLAFDATFIGDWNWEIKRRYQKAIVVFQAITRRESLFAMSGMNFERLSGRRKRHKKKSASKEYSVRLDRRWRIVMTFLGPLETESILILDVEDYH